MDSHQSYAGIGSRETPAEIISLMQDIAECLANFGYVLRSGGADGADTAFEIGCDRVQGQKEIYLPWRNFNNNPSKLFSPSRKAYEIAEDNHPYFEGLKEPARLLMARNTHQILGKDCSSPVAFVMCWTKDGANGTTIKTSNKSGGTGQAIRLAVSHNVPVFNLYLIETKKAWRRWVEAVST